MHHLVPREQAASSRRMRVAAYELASAQYKSRLTYRVYPKRREGLKDTNECTWTLVKAGMCRVLRVNEIYEGDRL